MLSEICDRPGAQTLAALKQAMNDKQRFAIKKGETRPYCQSLLQDKRDELFEGTARDELSLPILLTPG